MIAPKDFEIQSQIDSCQPQQDALSDLLKVDPTATSPLIEEHKSMQLPRNPEVRLIKGYMVYMNDHLGKGQYGQVCKAKLATEVKKKNSKTYACKIMEVANIKQSEWLCIEKEVQIHNMVKSEYCIQLYKPIKTASNLYMMLDYCNGYDLAQLLKARKTLTQAEIGLILSQVVAGCKHIWELNIIHRDIKLANILLHFPNNPELDSMPKSRKLEFLQRVDLRQVKFQALISDFGLSTVYVPGSTTHQSICGTPLYSAPQLLKRRSYSYKVDVWAIGIMCYEMLMGRTPFHAYEMKDLIAKINRGDYTIAIREPITIECALFLTQCLQANENDRLNVDQLLDHGFLQKNGVSGSSMKMNKLDKVQFQKELKELQKVALLSGQDGKGLILQNQSDKQNTTLVLNTQDKLQMVVLQSQLYQIKEDFKQLQLELNQTNFVPREELIIQDKYFEEPIEFESPAPNEQQLEIMDRLLRQYSGSQEQRKDQEIEIEVQPNRPISVRVSDGSIKLIAELEKKNELAEEENKQEGAWFKFTNAIQDIFCKKSVPDTVIDQSLSKIESNSGLIMENRKSKVVNEEQLRLLQMKVDRQQELEQSNQEIANPQAKEEDQFVLIE